MAQAQTGDHGGEAHHAVNSILYVGKTMIKSKLQYHWIWFFSFKWEEKLSLSPKYKETQASIAGVLFFPPKAAPLSAITN